MSQGLHLKGVPLLCIDVHTSQGPCSDGVPRYWCKASNVLVVPLAGWPFHSQTNSLALDKIPGHCTAAFGPLHNVLDVFAPRQRPRELENERACLHAHDLQTSSMSHADSSIKLS